MTELSQVMKDRKHAALFRQIYSNGATELLKALSDTSCVSFSDIVAQYHSDFISWLSVFDDLLCNNILKNEINDLLTCTSSRTPEYDLAAHVSMRLGTTTGLELVKQIKRKCDDYNRNPFNASESMKVMSSYNLLAAFSGQIIDVYNKAYKFCPDMTFSEKNVYRGFVCFDGFMGYVERGIDYIQINCVKGRMFVKSIEVPDIPLKVKCAGIEIDFKSNGNTAVLDYECEVNEKRDLFVIFRY